MLTWHCRVLCNILHSGCCEPHPPSSFARETPVWPPGKAETKSLHCIKQSVLPHPLSLTIEVIYVLTRTDLESSPLTSFSFRKQESRILFWKSAVSEKREGAIKEILIS